MRSIVAQRKGESGRQEAEGSKQKAEPTRGAYRLPTAYCLLPTAFCLLPSAFCLLPLPCRLPSPAPFLAWLAFHLLYSNLTQFLVKTTGEASRFAFSERIPPWETIVITSRRV